MNKLLPLLLAATFAVAGIAATPPALASGDRHHDHGHRYHHDRHGRDNRLRACKRRGGADALSSRCVRALLADAEVASILEDRALLPALADARLSTDAIVRELEISEALPASRLGAEPDPDDDAVVDMRTIEALQRNEGFESPDVAFTRAGPVRAGSFAPKGPGDFLTIEPEDRIYLDLAGFTLGLHAALSPNVNGYAMRMRSNGQTVAVLQWNWARNPKTSDLPPVGWNSSRRMHVASVSKFMTTIGLIHLLRAKGIDTKAKIINYLPQYWNPGPNVGLINFEHLMNHLSGFNTGGSASDFQTMKNAVEGGVSAAAVGNVGVYQNMNFGLMRILMATIGGYIDKSTDFGLEFINDIMWDVLTTAAYDNYMQAHVFNPVGAHPVLTKGAYTALANRYDGAGPGWNSGSLQGSPGGVGWHLTINEILDVARALRQGQLVSLTDAQTILDKSWGLNSPVNGYSTVNGPVYYKPGRWTDNLDPSVGRTEQCLLMMMPDNMEVVVFVNSEVTAAGLNLTGLVRTLYENNLVTLP